MSEITFKLLIPRVPNFIIVSDIKVDKRQYGFRESTKVSLGSLSDDQINAIAEDFRLAMLERAREQRGF